VQQTAKRRRKHKYGAKACVVDGVKFDSRREARRYLQLRLLERAGQIRELQLQPVFRLHALGGAVVGKYIADFRYIDVSRGEPVTEDVKGMRTTIYRWKARHMLAEYGITVREV
jgi:hypothetical protein